MLKRNKVDEPRIESVAVWLTAALIHVEGFG